MWRVNPGHHKQSEIYQYNVVDKKLETKEVCNTLYRKRNQPLCPRDPTVRLQDDKDRSTSALQARCKAV